MKNFRRILLGILMFLCVQNLYSQPEINPNGFNQFFYENGVLSSEGEMVNGQPEGFWKTYFESGTLKTEGNRLNSVLTGPWKFYREDGNLETIINYENGEKNGEELVFSAEGNLVQQFTNIDGKKEGEATYFYETGERYRTVNFQNDKEEGKGFEYAKDGRIITFLNYQASFIKSIEKVNRKNKNGQKKGYWVTFHPNGKKREEGYYTNGVKNGIFKFYDSRGELLRIEKYLGGNLVEDADEAMMLDIKKEYYEDGALKLIGSYREDSKQGVFREYDKAGDIVNSYIYTENVLIGEGVVDIEGKRQGPWKLYFPTGELRAEGEYVDGLKEGAWKYFFVDGKVEQKGKYRLDLPSGEWRWMFNNGETHREEYYRKGREDGHSIEYDASGAVIHEGDYIDGLKMGRWKYHVNDHMEEGEYIDGEKNGKWLYTYDNGKKNFEGEYLSGVPIGKHKYYYRSGRVKVEGKYEAGERDGDWKYYNEEGILDITVTFKQGVRTKVGGKKIKLPKELE